MNPKELFIQSRKPVDKRSRSDEIAADGLDVRFFLTAIRAGYGVSDDRYDGLSVSKVLSAIKDGSVWTQRGMGEKCVMALCEWVCMKESSEFIKSRYRKEDILVFSTKNNACSIVIGIKPNVDHVAKHVHDCWMNWNKERGYVSRISVWGEELMVEWEALSEQAKDLDRKTVYEVIEALKTIN